MQIFEPFYDSLFVERCHNPYVSSMPIIFNAFLEENDVEIELKAINYLILFFCIPIAKTFKDMWLRHAGANNFKLQVHKVLGN